MQTDSFHNVIAEKLRQNKDLVNLVKREDIRKILYLSHVPLRIHNKFLSELEHLNIIKIKNKRKIEIL